MGYLKPAGYGSFIWPCDPLGPGVRVASSAADAASLARPLSDEEWASLLKSGHRSELHLQLDGIPTIFVERALVDVFGRELAAPADYSVCEALWLDESIAHDLDCDRQSGVAAGRALDLVLAWQPLEDDGLTTALFSTPDVSCALAATVDDATATSFEMDSTTGLVAGTGYYVGHEYIVPAAVGSDSLEGVRRGVCGRPHYHTSEVGFGLRYVTDKPTAWRRRLVTLWEVLVSPEGRALGGSYATIGPYVRQRWRGFIDADEPATSAMGIVLRCLPIERLLAEPVGVKLSGEVNFSESGWPYPMGFDAHDQIRIRELAGSMADAIGPTNPETLRIGSIENWCHITEAAIQADFGSDTIDIKPRPALGAIDIECRFAGEFSHVFEVYPSGVWFLIRDNVMADAVDTDRGRARVPVDLSWNGSWLPIRFELDADSNLAELPEQGTGILESNGLRELVTWSEVRRISDDDPRVALRLSGREIGGSSRVDWSRGANFTVVSGATGSWQDVFRTLVTSSGLGVRGPHDTLPIGFGLGLDAADIDDASIDALDSPELDAMADEQASVADLLGGWVAIQRRCIVQRRGEDGRVRIAVVSTEPVSDTTADELGADEVLIGGGDEPKKMPAPNQIKIEAGLGSSKRSFVVNGRASQQVRGGVSWTMKLPGIGVYEATTRALNLMRLVDGQQALDLDLAPWSRIQVGDARQLTTASPQVYDWRTGARAPSSIHVRCVGIGPRVSGPRRATFLIAGQAQAQALLCPSPVITHIDTDRHRFRIARDQARWFAEGETIHVYNPGREDTGEAQDNEIDTITLGDTEAVIEVANPVLGAWAVAWETRITFPVYTDASARQTAFMFVRSNRYWR